MNLKKYNWQKPHQPNLTGTEKAYYPNKNKDNAIKKNTKVGKNKLLIFIFIVFFFNFQISQFTNNNFIGTKYRY